MKNQLFLELKTKLPDSNAEQRKYWAKKIVDTNFGILTLVPLLKSEYKIASRCSWLLSDIGYYDTSYLEESLDTLFSLRKEIKSIDFESRFIKYWTICGIPQSQEGIALNLLLKKLITQDVNVSAKSYIVDLLFKLYQKFPDIKEEFISFLEFELNRNSPTFQKKVKKILNVIKEE